MIRRMVANARRYLAQTAAGLKAPQWVSLALIAATVICAIVFLWLVYDTSLDKDTQLWGKGFLFLIGLLAALATVAVSWEADETPQLKRLATPWGAGIVMVAVFTAFGAMTDALSLFEPRAATAEDTGEIKADTEVIREEVVAINQLLQDQASSDANDFSLEDRAAFAQSCTDGDLEACTDLGILWSKGQGGPQDETMARRIYYDTCDKGGGRACALLGYMHVLGEGGPIDESMAIPYFQKACDLNIREGCSQATRLTILQKYQ